MTLRGKKRTLLMSVSSGVRDGKKHLCDLLRVYHDVERALRSIRLNHVESGSGQIDRKLVQINVGKLIQKLSHSKKTIERKIQRGLSHERRLIRKRLRALIGIRNEIDRVSQ
jgi:hypothetical protein